MPARDVGRYMPAFETGHKPRAFSSSEEMPIVHIQPMPSADQAAKPVGAGAANDRAHPARGGCHSAACAAPNHCPRQDALFALPMPDKPSPSPAAVVQVTCKGVGCPL